MKVLPLSGNLDTSEDKEYKPFPLRGKNSNQEDIRNDPSGNDNNDQNTSH